ncbi:hypothetical protein [Fluviispira multicolorata]|uniref:Response regulator receiver domain-containing protein n=1 Tax=Fluviispira multicolorata TaxID=2654512 RepID=A0A833JDY3_9BACT|nr:hypothetical protein [Fluviispira multicolorata]KAB8032113.1 hypothetical protein GCL57_05555 [Fluviispira multicolorata]
MNIAFIDDEDEFLFYWKENLSSHSLVFQKDIKFFINYCNIDLFDYIIVDFYFPDCHFYDIYEKKYKNLINENVKLSNIIIFSDAAQKILKKKYIKYIFKKSQPEKILKMILKNSL